MPPKVDRSQRWTSTCDAQRFLEELYDSGAIAPSDLPADIYSKHDIFQNFELSVFCTHLNMLRNKRGALRKSFDIFS